MRFEKSFDEFSARGLAIERFFREFEPLLLKLKMPVPT